MFGPRGLNRVMVLAALGMMLGGCSGHGRWAFTNTGTTGSAYAGTTVDTYVEPMHSQTASFEEVAARTQPVVQRTVVVAPAYRPRVVYRPMYRRPAYRPTIYYVPPRRHWYYRPY